AGSEEKFVATVTAHGPTAIVGDAPNVIERNLAINAPIYARPEAPVPGAWKEQAAPITALHAVADGAIQYLLIDEASAPTFIPWHEIERKLARNATVVAFSVSRGGYTRHATFALPAAIFPEITEDIPSAIDQITETFRLATPLVVQPPDVTSAAEFAAAL